MHVVAQYAGLHEVLTSLRSHRGVDMYKQLCDDLGRPVGNICLGCCERGPEFDRMVAAINHTLRLNSRYSPKQILKSMIEDKIPGSEKIKLSSRDHDADMTFPPGACVKICDIFMVAGELNTPSADDPGIIASVFGGKT